MTDRPRPGDASPVLRGSMGAEPPCEFVLHVDMDQFLAAVEVRRRPELRGRPVVVGGDGNPMRPRQVVATASYEARAFGVHSGMPLGRAVRLCPNAVFLPSDRPAYEAASTEVMATLRTFDAVVEVWGWDEAFMGVSTDDPVAMARSVQRRVLDATALTCAIGIGDTRLTAKTATGTAKPGGVASLTRRDWIATMGTRPVTAVWGIGGRTAARLADLGIATVEQLARADHEVLARHFGPTIGPHLRILGLGGDDSPLRAEPWIAKSRSKEETFTRDVAGAEAIVSHVVRLAVEVTESVVAEGRHVTHVAVKVRTATFWTRSKIAKLPGGPTTDPLEVSRMAVVVLERFGPLRPLRLLGVRVMLEELG
jgi:DNA polymerase-4